MTTLAVPDSLDLARRDRLVLGGVLLSEALLLVGYYGATGTQVTSVRYVLYPFVWINLALLAVTLVPLPRARGRRRRVALGVAGGYFLVLAFVSGLVALYLGGHAHGHEHVHGWQVAMTAPGWGPRVGYAGEAFHVYFVPYRVVGYLGLAYLAYVATVRASAGVAAGVFGFASCVGCSFPFVATLVGAFVGGSAALTTTALTYSMDLSTAAYVLAVGLLVWRPGLAELTGGERSDAGVRTDGGGRPPSRSTDTESGDSTDDRTH